MARQVSGAVGLALLPRVRVEAGLMRELARDIDGRRQQTATPSPAGSRRLRWRETQGTGRGRTKLELSRGKSEVDRCRPKAILISDKQTKATTSNHRSKIQAAHAASPVAPPVAMEEKTNQEPSAPYSNAYHQESAAPLNLA
ncbi:unnamed protein product [Lota lota]